jgi:branched-chain amino acid transport system substrate-binding protein
VTAPGRRLRVGACLSLSGRFARFGGQARYALEAWCSLGAKAELVIEDDASDRHVLESKMPDVASRCDVLLGPYSTQLMRAAGRMAAQSGWLMWNHGGSGDDVEAAHPGHVISVLTPTSGYARPFVRRIASCAENAEFWIAQGRGSFGEQVAVGAQASADDLGLRVRRASRDQLSSGPPEASWDLFSVGTFEDDVGIVRLASRLPNPPRHLCAVAAGVRDFGDLVDDPQGIYGVGQWFPGSGSAPELGPTEADFLAAYTRVAGRQPDYPAVQAVAAAVLAAHCAAQAGGTSRSLLWAAASELRTSTVFGRFEIDPTTGAQVAHEAALVRWGPDGPMSL